MPDATTPSAPPASDTRQPGLQLVDRRRPERIVVPFYVVERFGATIGPYGLALYLGLCYHVGRQRAVWPSLATLAREIGCSRSSVERSMRSLRAAGLVVTEPYLERGQRSNTVYLVDPPTAGDPSPMPPPPADRGGAVE